MNPESGLPPLFLERLKRLFPGDLYPDVLAGFESLKPPSVRIQKPGLTREQILSSLSEAGIPAQAIQDLPFPAFFLNKEDFRKFQAHPLYIDGVLYVQGLSSMLPVLVLAPRPGERILDLTAAPGSKTTLIALLMKGEGDLVANDSNKPRFFKMKTILERQGFPHVRMTMMAGEAYGRQEPECFDRVLVDAPCSGEARFIAGDSASQGYWKMMKVRELAKKQKRLFLSGFSALKPGGVLVYSTCTFAPEENEGVLSACLKRIGPAAEIEDIALPAVRTMEGLTSWEKDVYPPSLTRTRRIVPDARSEGFFIARVRKTGPWRWGKSMTQEIL